MLLGGERSAPSSPVLVESSEDPAVDEAGKVAEEEEGAGEEGSSRS